MFQILERFPRLRILHHVEENGVLWGTSGRWVLINRGMGWERFSQYPFKSPTDLFGFCRLSERAARADKCNVIVNSHGAVLGIRGGTVFRLMSGEPPLRLFDIQGDSVLHRSLCEDSEGWICFGEYFSNGERGPVRLWRVSPDLDAWEVAHEFLRGSIRHIHGVYRDPADPKSLWVTTGDYENECYLFRTQDRFATLERFGEGTQTWRAVSLLFTETHVCWLTDSHIHQNHACRMERSTGALELGQPIDCSGWYSLTTTDGLYAAFTTVEKGPAIHRLEASVLVSKDAFHWREIHAFRKDWWRPYRIFKYGVVSCPSGPMHSSSVFLSGEGLVGLEGETVRATLNAEPQGWNPHTLL